MAYGNTASDIMGQDGGHRSSPTCPPGAAELSFDREVKTEERDSFTSSAEVMGDKRVGRALQSIS